jgi:phytanoyl-CoA hydroxylase
MTTVEAVGRGMRFEEQGYVVVPGLLGPEDLRPVRDEYEQLLDRLAWQWHEEGRIADTYAGEPFETRLSHIVAAGDVPYFKAFDISLRFGRIRADDPIHLGPAVFGLLTNPALLSVLQELIGPEIYASPIQHTRIKVPERLLSARNRTSLSARATWHQDQAASLPEADDTDVVTVWVAVTDATVRNGCLMVIPHSHDQLFQHCSHGAAGRNLSIPDQLLPAEPVSLEVSSGSVIFMHRRLIHQSHVNASDGLRWSFDFRYQPTGLPTGRPQFPGFVAHSVRDPGSVLTDPDQWARQWLDTRARLAEDDGGTRDYRRRADGDTAC